MRAGVQFAAAGAIYVVFDANSGTYFTLRGGAAIAWGKLTSGGSEPTECDSPGAYEGAFRSLGLIGGGSAVECEELPDLESLGITRHSELDHLMLQDPAIDIDLLGGTHHAPLPRSNRRILVDRIRVRRFVSALAQDAHRYAASHQMTQFQVGMGDSIVQVQVPQSDEDAPIPVSNAFLPLQSTTEATADFCITVIDDGPGLQRQPTDFEMDWHLPLGLVDPDLTGDARIAVDRHTQTVSVFTPSTRQCVVWTRNFRDLPYWFAATPFRLQLSWIADWLGLEFLHAAAVMIDDRAVLFAGPSGAGKSTTALMCAQQGFPLVADDFLVASSESVQGIYRRVKVHDARLSQTVHVDWPVLNPHAEGQKRIVEIDRALVAGPSRIGCIVVPRVGTGCQLELLDSGDALSAIAPPSLSGLLGGNHASLSRLAELVTRFPCYQLTVDDRIFQEPSTIKSIIKAIRAQGVTRG